MDTTARLQGLLDRLNQGDAAARDRLLEHSLGRVERLARRMLGRNSDLRELGETGDLLGETMRRLCGALEAVRPVNVRAYFALAGNHVRLALLDLVREKAARSRVRYSAEPPEPAAPGGGPADLAEWAEFHERVGALPEEEREAFDAVFYQGLTRAEAAALLGVSVRTVNRRWQHARLRLGGYAPGGPG